MHWVFFKVRALTPALFSASPRADKVVTGPARERQYRWADEMTDQEDAQDRQAIVEVITMFGQSIDRQDWGALRACLSPTLDTDYSSFRGTPPASLAADDFVDMRRTGLAGLATHHVSSGHLVQISGDTATCKCDFVIRRWFADSKDARFLNSYGHYEYDLQSASGRWTIVGIKQIVTRNDGDLSLHGALR